MTKYSVGVSDYLNPWQTPEWNFELKNLGTPWIRNDMQRSSPTSNYGMFIQNLKDSGYKWLCIFGKRMKGWGSDDWLPTVDIADWEEQVDWALANYGHLIDAVEFPNEPDLPQSNFGYMDGTPERVYEMLQVVYSKVKAYNPSIPVICGALGTMRNTQSVPGDYYGGYLLQSIVDLGANNYCDGYSFHIYKWFLNGYNDLYSAIDCYDRGKAIIGNKPFWMTEMGINTVADIPSFENWLTELYNAGCPFINYYSLYVESYSLLNSDLSERPWYTVYKSFIEIAPPEPEPTIPLWIIIPTVIGLGLLFIKRK